MTAFCWEVALEFVTVWRKHICETLLEQRSNRIIQEEKRENEIIYCGTYILQSG